MSHSESEPVISRRQFFDITGKLLTAVLIAELGVEFAQRSNDFYPFLSQVYKIFDFRTQQMSVFREQLQYLLSLIPVDKSMPFRTGYINLNCTDQNSQVQSYTIPTYNAIGEGRVWDQDAINNAQAGLLRQRPNEVSAYRLSMELYQELGSFSSSAFPDFFAKQSSAETYYLTRTVTLSMLIDEVIGLWFVFTDETLATGKGNMMADCSLFRQREHKLFPDKPFQQNDQIYTNQNGVQHALTIDQYAQLFSILDLHEPILR